MTSRRAPPSLPLKGPEAARTPTVRRPQRGRRGTGEARSGQTHGGGPLGPPPRPIPSMHYSCPPGSHLPLIPLPSMHCGCPPSSHLPPHSHSQHALRRPHLGPSHMREGGGQPLGGALRAVHAGSAPPPPARGMPGEESPGLPPAQCACGEEAAQPPPLPAAGRGRGRRRRAQEPG